MGKHTKPPKHKCSRCHRTFKTWLGWQWHKTDAHPLWKDK